MTNKKHLFPGLLALALLVANVALAVAPVSAASLQTTYLRLDRMKAGQTTSGRLVFKAVSTGAPANVSINMNGADTTTWTGSGGSVAASPVASSAACATDSGATALPGTLASTGTTGTITITGVTALTAGTTYCVDLTAAAAFTVATAGEYHPVITSGTDSTTIAVRSVTNDQIVVNAIVPPTFNFALNGNIDNFTANLASGTVGTTTGVTATVNTNARAGWIAWAKDSNSGLTSAAAGKTIAGTTPGTSATLATNTEGYVVGITAISQGAGGGVTTANAAYNAQSGAHGSGLDATYRNIAASTGTADTAVITLKERASISPLTPAATDYTDTITIIGAGNF